MKRSGFLSSSLRARLIVTTLVIQAVVLGLFVYKHIEDSGERLQEQAQLRVQQLTVLLNASLAVPLAQMDYASAQEILDETRKQGDLSYLRLYDFQNRLVCDSVGQSAPQPPLDRDIAHDDGDQVHDVVLPITLAGQRLGTLEFGVPLDFLQSAREHTLRDGLSLGLLALVVSAIFLSAMTVWLTRRLGKLAQAADRVSDGKYDVRLPVGGNDEVGRVVTAFNGMVESLGEREMQLNASKEHLIYLAERDSLTGLYNRHFLRQEMMRRVEDAARQGTQGALLLFDLDEFKAINDTLGHLAGDELLIRVAGEVERLIRRNEIFCRLGGDEFVLVVPHTTELQVTALAERIVNTIGEMRIEVEGQSLRVSCSLGIVLYPQHSDDTETLMAYADAAMYRAKQAGKNIWKLYQPELDSSQQLVATLTWKERIAKALEGNGLRLHFQGIYAMPDCRLSHLEALVRMVDETTGGLIPPGQFIGIAEKLGLVVQIDRWVIRQAVQTLRQNPNITPIAINISGRSFDEPDLPAYIAAQLRENGVEPLRLIIELTETAAVSDLADAERFIQELRKIGCIVCLDDFGSGFASFAYLKHIQADAIKIDGMFIRDLPNDAQNQVFVRAMVEVARGLGVTTVAECVEDAATLSMLRSYGVDQVQGYHLDKPRADHPALGPVVA